METRVKKLELVTERLARRSVKVSTGLITPYPISAAKSGDNVQGEILNYMFPCEGIITKGAIKLGDRFSGSITVRFKLFNDTNTYTDELNLERKLTIISPHRKVQPFDCLSISIFADPEHPITRIWVSFLWIPTVKDVEVKSFLISELENQDAL